jgi:hypothetical protein
MQILPTFRKEKTMSELHSDKPRNPNREIFSTIIIEANKDRIIGAGSEANMHSQASLKAQRGLDVAIAGYTLNFDGQLPNQVETSIELIQQSISFCLSNP